MATPSAQIQRPFTDTYLLEYSKEHVYYEVDHFFWLANLLGGTGVTLRTPSPADGQRLSNIMIEGFVIHLRNVIDFLYLPPRQPTDVIAEDFFLPGAWNTIRPAISNTLDTARIRANKEIAHLTTQRIVGSPPGKRWDFPGLASEIRPLIKLVTVNALPSRLSPTVDVAIS